MERFLDVLAVGGKTNSLGRAEEVITHILSDKSKLDELYDCLFADDAWVRMRAIDSLEKICRDHPDWIEPYIDRMFMDLKASTQPSILWHLAEIFAEVKLSPPQKEVAISWLKDMLSTKDADWIVSVNAMKSLLHFKSEGVVTTEEIKPLFELQQTHKSNAVKKKATLYLQSLRGK